MLSAIRLVHTLIYLVMAGSVVYILYCGIVARIGTGTYIALGLVVVECVVFVGNGMKCPLTTLAKEHGAEKGYVFDAFIPERLTRYTVPTFGTLFALALALLLYRALS
ncbi:MAG: hypothetical protein KIT11_00470 [Fimbriimonadaceae bacterium]|nr:hypothetical protein [Fimbriimonadaceae bacterium]QYK55153.1 MAG: hypothetical protein KF733_09065 [Fimbriimonadaceae bacterium]